MPAKLRLSVIAVTIVAAMLGGGAVAHANPPPPQPETSRPLTCLDQFNENDDYVGEGWVDAMVAEVNNIFLGCGDEFSGVVHIASHRSDGNTHPITAATERAFLLCFSRLATEGSVRPDDRFPRNRDRYELSFTEPNPTPFGPSTIPVQATMIVDRNAQFVWGMFTTTTANTPRGNNWFGCSGLLDVA